MRIDSIYYGIRLVIVPQEAEVTDVPPQKIRARRGAVSASVMTEEQATSYVKKVNSIIIVCRCKCC